MPTGVIRKKVDEKYPIAVDYSDILGSGETIAGLTVDISPGSGSPDLDKSGGALINDPEAGWVVIEGVAGTLYKCKFTMTTSIGRIFVDYLYVRVVE